VEVFRSNHRCYGTPYMVMAATICCESILYTKKTSMPTTASLAASCNRCLPRLSGRLSSVSPRREGHGLIKHLYWHWMGTINLDAVSPSSLWESRAAQVSCKSQFTPTHRSTSTSPCPSRLHRPRYDIWSINTEPIVRRLPNHYAQ
jgi:hypothetical protein